MSGVFARVSRSSPLVALGPKVFRKEMLRVGTWSHPDAPGGKLEVTEEMFDRIISNFHRRVRDNVPVPLGHDMDAISNSGHVIGVEKEGDRLYGLIEIKDDEIAEDIEKGLLTGGSALINLNHVDYESGEEHGPVLVHWAITNAPYIKGLAPYETVALGEDGRGALVISLNDNDKKEEGSVDPIKQALESLKDASDEDIRKALAELRPDVLAGDGDDEAPDLEKIKAEAKEEGKKELAAALSEAGLTVTLSEKKADAPKVDVSSAPEFVALSEKLAAMEKERAQEKAEAVVDAAIKDGKVLPAQRDALIEVALSEGGMERLTKLIPADPIVELGELGTDPSKETNVTLSEEDAEKEANRYITAYHKAGKGGEG